MKTFAVVGFLALLQISVAQEPGKFAPEEEDCIRDLKLDKGEIEAVLQEPSLYLPEDDAKFNEFLSCFWIKKGYQEEDGEINYGSVIQLVKNFTKDKFGGASSDTLGLQIATQAVENCKNVPSGDTHGQTAAKVQNCITKHIEELVK